MSSSLMLGLKAGEIRKIWWVNCRSQVCCEGRIGFLAEEFLSWPLWYNKDGLVDMAYTTCTMDLRISWCLGYGMRDSVLDDSASRVRMLCRCKSCVQGLWNGHDAPTNQPFLSDRCRIFSTFSGLAFSMVVAHEFAVVLHVMGNFRRCNSGKRRATCKTHGRHSILWVILLCF